MTKKIIILRVNFTCLDSDEAACIGNILGENLAKYGMIRALRSPEKYWKYPDQFQVCFEIDLNSNWTFKTMSLDLASDWDIYSSQEAIWDSEKKPKEKVFIDRHVLWAHVEEI